jgi:hypothetical protein
MLPRLSSSELLQASSKSRRACARSECASSFAKQSGPRENGRMLTTTCNWHETTYSWLAFAQNLGSSFTRASCIYNVRCGHLSHRLSSPNAPRVMSEVPALSTFWPSGKSFRHSISSIDIVHSPTAQHVNSSPHHRHAAPGATPIVGILHCEPPLQTRQHADNLP